MDKKWRPMMGWVYMLICIMDFIVFPVLWSVMQSLALGDVTSPWDPITLKGAGLFHMAMGAVLGVTAWSRGQEKMTRLNTPINTYSTPYRNRVEDDYGDPINRNTRND